MAKAPAFAMSPDVENVTLMSRDRLVSFYAGAKHFPLPYTERYDELLTCLRINRVDYLLVDESVFVPLRPKLTFLLDPQAPHPGLRLERMVLEPRKILLYRLDRGE